MNECTDNKCEIGKGSCDSSAHCCTSGRNESCCHDNYADDLVYLAKQAKKELIKEKMKAALEAKIGKKLDKVAALAVETALEWMKHKKEGKEACDKYHASLENILKS